MRSLMRDVVAGLLFLVSAGMSCGQEVDYLRLCRIENGFCCGLEFDVWVCSCGSSADVWEIPHKLIYGNE